MKKVSISFILVLVLALAMNGCGGKQAQVDYSAAENWAYRETADSVKPADLFFIAPTVYSGIPQQQNMSMTDQKTMGAFLGAINMELGIYQAQCRIFAPYYEQVGLSVYELEIPDREPYLDIAYGDVKAAFTYYMNHYNHDRPIVLAGFSQGAQLTLRLMEELGQTFSHQLVACYAIGWNITQEELEQYPHLKMAQGPDDTGVIISFNSEAPHINNSLTVPQGIKTLSINPLNWKTDSTPADRSLNLGACFTDYSGQIVTETAGLTGAYLDPIRGTLKVPDVSEEAYPPVLDLFAPGIYHLYDYQFFYRNLQQNVADRVRAFLENS